MSALSPEHELILDWHAVARTALSDRPDAYLWIAQVQDLALVIDHVVDGDALDNRVFIQAMKNTLLDWPLNRFYQENRAALVPALAGCLSAWERSDKTDAERILAYHPAGELAVTVLYLVGGSPRVDTYGGLLRAIAATICQHNDEKS